MRGLRVSQYQSSTMKRYIYWKYEERLEDQLWVQQAIMPDNNNEIYCKSLLFVRRAIFENFYFGLKLMMQAYRRGNGPIQESMSSSDSFSADFPHNCNPNPPRDCEMIRTDGKTDIPSTLHVHLTFDSKEYIKLLLIRCSSLRC